MSEVKNKKKKSSIIQVSIGVLAVIMAILIIIMMGIVSDIQGTARIVNYTGLVRGETQRLIKLELSMQQENEMIHDIRTLDIPELAEKCRKREYIGKSRSYKFYQSGELIKHREDDREYMGRTLYLGSLKSDVYFCTGEIWIWAVALLKQAEVCARYHINAGRSATSIVATDSVFLF